MTDLSQLNVNNTDYNLKDAAARNDIRSTQVVSGNPLTLTDAAPINAESLVVEFSPKQDLHGQSAPYVGGAGKNKVDISETTISSSDYVFNLTNFNIPQGTYTFSFDCTEDGNASFACGDDNTDFVNDPILVRDGKGAITFTTTNTITQMRLYGYAATYSNFQLEVGSQATSFAPYSNICPITGYTECEVESVGNILPTDYAEWMESGNYTYFKIPNFNGETYTIRVVDKDPTVYLGRCSIGFIDNYPTEIVNFTWVVDEGVEQTNHTNVVNNVACDTIVLYPAAQSTLETLLARYEIFVYSSAQSTSASISFGQTVHGGRSNFTDGGTDVTYGFITIDETASIEEQTSGDNKRFCITAAVTDVDEYSTDHICEMLEIASGNNATRCYTEDNKFAVYAAGYIFISHIAEDVTALRALLAETPLKVAYVLNTVSTLSTPVTPLKLLKGTNNITTNGTTINLGYQPDNVIGEVKGEIDKHLEMPYVKVIDNNTTINFDDIPIEYAQEYAYVLADNEFFKHRFILLEIYEMVGGLFRNYVNGSALLSIDTLLEFSGSAYGEMISFSRNFTIVEVLVGIVEDDGVYKLTISLENDGQTQFNDFRARARYID